MKMRSERRQAVWDMTAGKCFYCGLRLIADDGPDTIDYDQSWMNVDRFVPRARGGSSALSNLVPSCMQCSSKKGGLLGGSLVRRVA